jgi:hypothetical protein
VPVGGLALTAAGVHKKKRKKQKVEVLEEVVREIRLDQSQMAM